MAGHLKKWTGIRWRFFTFFVFSGAFPKPMAVSSIVCEESTGFEFDAVHFPHFTRRSPPRQETSAKNTLRRRLGPRASLFAYFHELADPACECTLCSLHMVLRPKSLFLLFSCRATRPYFPLAVSSTHEFSSFVERRGPYTNA